jgi:DNA-binding SARP family transcriptional activator
VEFRVLGPIEVVDAGRAVDIGPPKQRSVLAALLLRANQVVSLDSLVDQVWGDDPPLKAVGALQAYVSNLRRVLEPQRAPRSPATVLVSRPPGYLLVVAPADHDAVLFDAALGEAEDLLRRGRAETAAVRLDEALSLWRGPAYADVAFEEFARAEAARLEDLRSLARQLRAEADLALGRHAVALPDLEQLVAEHPLREQLWALLIVALYRSGRQADALRAYQNCRRALIDQLGLEPGPELRQLEEAVLAHSEELSWPAAREDRAAAPVVIEPEPEPVEADRRPFVGRTEQLSRLGRAWSSTRSGQAALVLVSGEPGIGKTRMVEELARQLPSADVAWGRCWEGEGAPSFWPWIQVLRDLGASYPGGLEAAAAEAGLPPDRLAPLVPEWDPGDPVVPVGADPGEVRFGLNEAALKLLLRLGRGRPVLVVLDDLHWGDAPSLHLLQHLAVQVADVPLLVVGTYRDLEVRAGHPLADALATMARRPSVERIRLSGLTESDIAELLARRTRGEPSPALVGAVHARTGGNPFFVTELVRLLETEGGLDQPGMARRSEVPEGVRDVIRRRLVRLPEQTAALLSVAAVAGEDFDVPVIEAVAGIEQEALLEAVELALLSGLVVEGGDDPLHFRFSHALVRETLYDGLSAIRRSRLHVRVAEALERLHAQRPDAVAAEIAGHFLRAGPVAEQTRAIPYLLRSSEVAQRTSAYERAEAELRRALDLLEASPPTEERDRHERWAQARLGVLLGWTRGQGAPEATRAFARARELCQAAADSAEELPALYGLYVASLFVPDLDGALRYAQLLLDAGQRHEDPRYSLAGHLAFGMPLFQRGELRASLQHSERATVLADSLGEPWLADVLQGEPRSMSRCYRALGLALSGQAEASAALSADALEVAQQAGHPFSVTAVLTMRAWATLLGGDPVATEQAATAALEDAERRGFTLLMGGNLVFHGWALARLGDPSAGLSQVRAGLEAVEATGMRTVRHFQLAVQAEVECAAGQYDDALASVERGLAEVRATGDCFYEAELYRLRALAAAAAGRAGESEPAEDVARAVAMARAQGAGALETRALASIRALRGAPWTA